MILLEKEDSLFGQKNNKRHLKKLLVDYKDPQFYICLTDKEDFNYILTQSNLPLVVHCTKFKMDSKSSLPMQARECQRQLRIILSQDERCVVWQ